MQTQIYYMVGETLESLGIAVKSKFKYCSLEDGIAECPDDKSDYTTQYMMVIYNPNVDS